MPDPNPVTATAGLADDVLGGRGAGHVRADAAAVPPPITADAFRSVFRRHAAGVAVVTAASPAGPAGFTATSLVSVSVDPPLLSFGISSGASSWPAVSRAAYVGVHVLAGHQEDVAALFARSGADRFGPSTGWAAGPHGVPLLDGVAAWLVCRTVALVPAGDHRLVIAQPVAAEPEAAGAGHGPLLYHQGAFHRLGR